MRDRRVGAVLVTEGDHCLVGIFTGRDAVHKYLYDGGRLPEGVSLKKAGHSTPK